jgi:maltose/moltooligosaccharide transporter
VVIVVPANLIWLLWHPAPSTTYYVWIVLMVILGAPATALIGMFDPPLFMRIFPRERYGQFCSANSLMRSASFIVMGFLSGFYLDLMKKFVGEKNAYFYLPFWWFVFYGLMLFFSILLYRSWKRYGGDNDYVPPMPESAPAKS